MTKRRLSSSPWFASLIACGAALITLQSAAAHQFWIEKAKDGNFFVRFGHAGSKDEKAEYEKTPGVLDKMQGLSVWTMYPSKSGIEPELYKAKPQEDGFLIEEASTKLPLLAQSTFPVRKRAAEEGRPAMANFTTVYARWQPKGVEAEPVTTLDLVPSTDASKVTVYYKGKPLAGAKVTLFGPDAEPTSLEAGSDGVVEVKVEAKGDVVLWAHHSEPAEGNYLGSPYTSEGYTMCLCWKHD